LRGTNGTWKTEFLDCAAKLMRSVIDVGATDGYGSVYIRAAFRSPKVKGVVLPEEATGLSAGRPAVEIDVRCVCAPTTIS